jgi:uncharacterized membrane protein YphA (DoxX/SURF4 family)
VTDRRVASVSWRGAVMNAVVWVLQILLALAFLLAGVMKSTQPRQKLATSMGWVEDFSDSTVRTIGVLEVLAALTHRRRGETQMIGINAVLLLVAVVVAWARFGPYPL